VVMRALVLGGGGFKGAWQAGALQCLMGERARRYDVICGVSVGALNAAWLAQHSKLRQGVASHGLVQLWRDMKRSDVLKSWKLGIFSGLIWGPSLYDSKPLSKFIKKNIEPKRISRSGVRLRVGAVSIRSGSFHVWTENDPDLLRGVLASSAFPGALTPVDVDGDPCFDGGVREISPLRLAIYAGATEIDVVSCNPENIERDESEDRKPMGDVLRALDIAFHEIETNDLNTAQRFSQMCPGCQARLKRRPLEIQVFRPPRSLTSNPLDFRPQLIRTMIDQGFSYTREITE
jgi:NTE family protein